MVQIDVWRNKDAKSIQRVEFPSLDHAIGLHARVLHEETKGEAIRVFYDKEVNCWIVDSVVSTYFLKEI